MIDQIVNYTKAGYAGLYIVSFEDHRVHGDIVEAVNRMPKSEGAFKFFNWSCTTGLVYLEQGSPTAVPNTEDIFSALSWYYDPSRKETNCSFLIINGLHLYISDPNPVLYQQIKDSLHFGKTCNRHMIAVCPTLKLPIDLEKWFTVIEYKLPDREQLLKIATHIAHDASLKLNGHTDQILDAASGLTTTEAENAFALSVIESKDITPAIVSREKAATIKKNGLLEVMEPDAGIDDIGGFGEVKSWLNKRRNAFSKKARAYGLPMPKGFLQVGVPGTGKTLIAKATASILGIPLLKLDGGKLFGSLVGQSEANIRSVIQTAEAIAPCVVLVDELEKAFSGSKSSGQTDGGTSSRVLGTFLQWMNDKTAPVFVVATANDITQLPPELLRKGRFDEMFFVDLPDSSERQEIWKIQIQRHGRDPKKFDLKQLADATPDWTGAEVEALFREALYAAFDAGGEPTTELLLELSKDTVPLSKTMAEQITHLRNWAKGKARRASKAATTETATVHRKLMSN